MARKHNVDEVLRSLSSKRDLKFDEGRRIKILTDTVWDKQLKKDIRNPDKTFDLGNGSWGKIDFLTKYYDYFVVYVGSFRR